VVYCSVVFLFNIGLWLCWMPWVISVGIAFENTVIHLAAMTMSGMIFAAGSLLFMINTKDPSDSAAVTSALGSLNLAMALMTAFNGLAVPNQLFDRAPWLLWLSFNFPASISLVQNILEVRKDLSCSSCRGIVGNLDSLSATQGQKINCDSERCIDVNASLFVKILDFDKHDEAIVPLLVLLGETILVWILVVIMINRRCLRICPKLRATNDDLAKATSADEAKFFRNVVVPTANNVQEVSSQTVPRLTDTTAPVTTAVVSTGPTSEMEASEQNSTVVAVLAQARPWRHVAVTICTLSSSTSRNSY
jgi:hypothetical protein